MPALLGPLIFCGSPQISLFVRRTCVDVLSVAPAAVLAAAVHSAGDYGSRIPDDPAATIAAIATVLGGGRMPTNRSGTCWAGRPSGLALPERADDRRASTGGDDRPRLLRCDGVPTRLASAHAW